VVYVDLMQSALTEAGDLMIPMHAGVISQADIVGELGQVLAGEVAGRSDDGQITVYKSLGIVAQDLIAAAHVYRLACEQGEGCMVAL
jgi:ornithine cyclodeaminase